MVLTMTTFWFNFEHMLKLCNVLSKLRLKTVCTLHFRYTFFDVLANWENIYFLEEKLQNKKIK